MTANTHLKLLSEVKILFMIKYTMLPDVIRVIV